MTTTQTANEPLVIEQDHEADGGEVYGPMSVFWSKGHGHDYRTFMRAVVDYCLDEDRVLPRFDPMEDDGPQELWQYNQVVEDGILYQRATAPGQYARRSDWFPVTVLDLERPKRHGRTKCSVKDCREPWHSGRPTRVVLSPDDGEATLGSRYLAVETWLCRAHEQEFPDPSYRVFMVPVGATIMLPTAEEQTA